VNVVLFYPRGYGYAGKKPAVSTLAVTLPPIGIVSCAAVLRAAGHSVTVMDAACHYEISNDQWVERIIRCTPDIVGFSTLTASFFDAYDVCRRLKERMGSTIKTVFGGVHVSWGKKLILQQFDAIDCLIAGEGEYALRDLCDNKDPAAIRGLWYRENGTLKNGPDQTKTSLCAMDDLPFPAYDLLADFPRRYAMPLFTYPQGPGASIISSRGCVFACDFCDRSVFHTSFRWNSPEYTFELIKKMRADYGIRHFMFYDDLFTLNRDRVSRLCTLLRESGLGITFNCIVRIGHIDKALIDELKSAGRWMIHAGIESGDQDILNSFKGGLTLESIRHDVTMLHKSGLWVKGLFMMGFPGESAASIQKTIDFACSLPLKDANLTAFTPFPGAPLSRDIGKLGDFDQDFKNWSKMDCVNFLFVPKEVASKEVLEKLYRSFFPRFYNRPFMRMVFAKMIVQSPHSYWRLIKNLPAFLRYARNI